MRLWYKIYFLVVAGCLILLGMLTLALPERTFSQNENRVLEQCPAFSWRSFLEGELQEKWERMVNDQFPGRDVLTATASLGQRAIGLRDVGETYIGENNYYFSKKTDDDIDMFRYMENLRYIEYLSNALEQPAALLLVPSAGTILSDELPAYAPFYNADAMYKAGKAVCKSTHLLDMRDGLKGLKQMDMYGDTYFHTDHHWSLHGAYAGYEALCQEFDFEEKAYGYFEPEVVSSDFLGTLHSRVLDGNAKPDKLYAATNIPPLVSVKCDNRSVDGIYDKRKLQEKDKYAYFFGGNYGKVTIQTKNTTGRELLLFKDSFANSLVPFLLEEYDEITMIDLRYSRESVESILQEKNDADVVVLYEMSSFAEDGNLWKLTK